MKAYAIFLLLLLVSLIGGLLYAQKLDIERRSQAYLLCLASGRGDYACYQQTGLLPSEVVKVEFEPPTSTEDGTIKHTNIFNDTVSE